MMRKLLLINMAVATLAAGALMSDRAEATTLGGSAGARTATEGASSIEEVAIRLPPWGSYPRHYYPRSRSKSQYVPYGYGQLPSIGGRLRGRPGSCCHRRR
jgi:hypothetical protein